MRQTIHGSRETAPFARHGTWSQRVGAYSALPALVRQLGHDPETALAGVGLASDALDDPEGRVPYSALSRLLHDTAIATGCAHVGLLAGRIWHLEDLGLVGEMARDSATVREALHTLTVHQHLNSGGGLAFLLERGEFVDFGYAVYHPGVSRTEQLYDSVLAVSFNVLRRLCGPGWIPSQVLLPHAEPRDCSPYRRLLKVQPTFNAEYCATRFPSSWLDRPVEGADAVQRRLAIRRAAEAPGEPLIQQVFRALRLVLLHGKTSGDDVASVLSMHRRTLNRRLQAHGTTFQQVLDQVRYDVARQLLADSDISLDDVAATLGYAGVSPFMRTFRRWAGTTPGRWRRMATSGRLADCKPHWRPAFDSASEVRSGGNRAA